MSFTRDELVAEARTWKGTPFHHQGRLKGPKGGVDCVGLLVGIARHFGIPHEDTIDYPKRPTGDILVRTLARFMHPIALGQAKKGDVVVCWYHEPEHPVHALILTGEKMLHTYALVRKVVEHNIDDWWRKRFVCAFRFPGIVD